MTKDNRIKEWRTRRGLSLQQLAERVGTNKSQIDKLEKGARRLTVEWMVRLGTALQCEPRELMLTPVTMPPSQELIPVRECGRSTPTDYVARPPFLAHVTDAYAVYVMDTTMLPRYRPGQLLYVHPHLPPQAGMGVLVPKTGIVGEYDGARVRLYHPKPRTMPLPRGAVIHVIAGVWERN